MITKKIFVGSSISISDTTCVHRFGASAADANETDVLAVDEPTNIIDEKLALDYSSEVSAVANDTNVIENSGNNLLSADNGEENKVLKDIAAENKDSIVSASLIDAVWTYLDEGSGSEEDLDGASLYFPLTYNPVCYVRYANGTALPEGTNITICYSTSSIKLNCSSITSRVISKITICYITITIEVNCTSTIRSGVISKITIFNTT